MVDNTGFISRLGATTQLVDGTDAIHTGIIKTLNTAMGQNRLISTAVLTQGTSGGYTAYEVEKTNKVISSNIEFSFELKFIRPSKEFLLSFSI